MKRREFITLLGGVAAWPLAARAQQSPRKLYRIGFLGVTSHAEQGSYVQSLRSGLRRFGYEEGKNIIIHDRWAEGRYDRLPELATELVKLNVDVLVTYGTPGALAAKEATSTIPIVANSGDPVDTGLVASLARPGGNLTGLTFFWTEVCAKRVELIKEAIPTLIRLAVLVNPANPARPAAVAAMQHAAGTLGLELVEVEVKPQDDFHAAIATAATRGAQALVACEEPLITSNASQIAGIALQRGLPLIGFKPQAESGALMEYGVDFVHSFYRLAAFVDKVLKGTPPTDLPIERAVKFDLVVNLKSAKTLGIELPSSLLIRANEVIE